jgi:sulfur-oxidizing protein SoxB
MRTPKGPLQADRKYKVAGWAPVAEDASGEPVWDVVARHLRAKKRIAPIEPQRPRLIGVQGNPGIS